MKSSRLGRVLAGLVMLLALRPALAGGRTFQLLDASGRPVPNARLSVLGRTGSAGADAEGRFRLDPVPPVPFELAAADERGAWLGLLRVERLSNAPTETLRLPEAAKAEVTVRAGLAPATLAPPAAAPTVFSRGQIDEQRPSRLADALAEIPGTGRLEEGQSVVPSIRGLARSRVLLLLDDARITAERRAGTSAGFLDPFALENVEVVRGPGSVAYGSDALGGVLHARTPMPRPDVLGGRFELSTAVSGEKSAGIGLEANVPAGPVAFLVQANARSYRDFESPTRTVDNSASRDRSLHVRGLFPVGKGKLFFGVLVARVADMGKPALDSSVTRAYYPEERSDRFTLGLDLPDVAGFTALELRAFFGRYELVTNRDRFPTPAQDGRLSQADVDARDAQLRATATRPLGSGSLRVGLDVVSRFDLSATNLFVDYRAAGETRRQFEVAVADADRVDAGLFVETEQVLSKDRLHASLGLRGDVVSSRNRGGFFGDQDVSKGALSGFVALTFFPAPDWSLTAQYARGFRDPLLSDRYFRGVSGRGFVVGNPDLTAETSHQFDLALRTSLGPVRLAAYGFVYRIQDLIERYTAGNDFRFRNRGEAELTGGELEADARIVGGLSTRLALGTTRGRIRDDGSYAADVPPRSASLSVDYAFPAGFWLRARGAVYGRDSAPGPTEKETPGFVVVDLSAGYRLPMGLEGRVIVKNLLDKSHPGTSDVVAVDAPGRTVSFVLGGSF